jgi:hypothetical protein
MDQMSDEEWMARMGSALVHECVIFRNVGEIESSITLKFSIKSTLTFDELDEFMAVEFRGWQVLSVIFDESDTGK